MSADARAVTLAMTAPIVSTSGPRVAVAATFTADPLAPTLDFWLQQLWGAGSVTFAPFNQVLQQLLDSTSALRRADAGVVLVRPADWLPSPPRRMAPLPEVPGLDRHRLPDGLEVYHLNRYETEYVHHEIFVDRAYLRHGITLTPDATVVDIGANIGLFALFVQTHAPGARVIALEPSPAAFAALSANVARYGGRVTALPYGAGDRDGTAAFTAYTKSSVFSSFHADRDEDRAAIRAVIHNVVRSDGTAAPADVDTLADALVEDRLEARVVEVPVRTVSSVLAEVGVGPIDLLKVDAEKSEVAILAGITPADWRRIRQVVIEVHDTVGDRADAVKRLLESHGFTVTSDQETLLAGSGLYNFYAVRAGTAEREPAADAAGLADVPLPAAAEEFVRILREVAPALAAPLTVVCCPAPEASPRAIAIEAAIVDAMDGVPSVSVVSSTAWLRRYPVDDLHDHQGHALGQVPYTPDGFAALATTIARQLWTTSQPRAKVIVVDADQTLWNGVLGEDGVHGLTIGAGRIALHRFLLAQRDTGVLLAVCSKNDATDVLAALRDHPDSLIRPEHLSAHAIGWAAKSAGLHAIAADLNVGVDSLVFLDDNPAECAEVAAGCPGVITWCVPTDERDLPAFLDHLWPLDARRVTDEDRRRADAYRESRERQAFQASSSNYQAFIDGLRLAVDIAPVDAGTWPRALQLFERTNQFNFTTWRPSEAELSQAVATGLELLVVHVVDRFGDYGLTGLAGVRQDGAVLSVDACLLSCRVLGKGVEHRVLAHLGRVALERGLVKVRITFRPSPRNEPARRFADSVGHAMSTAAGDFVYEWSAPEAAATVFVATTSMGVPASDEDRPRTTPAALPRGPATGTLSRIPVALRTPTAVRRATLRARDGGALESPATPAEQQLAAIWADCLRFDEVGIDEDIFALGGDSITAVMIAARATREGLRLTPRDVLAQGTIRRLAALAGAPTTAPAAPSAPTATAAELTATPMQAMYFAQYVAGLDAGFEQFTLTVRGTLDPGRLDQAWQRVVERHDALRSSFHDVGGRIVQRVAGAAVVPTETLDWRGQPPADQYAQLAQLADADRARRFDLAQAPLMRVTNVRLADDEWKVRWSFHHLVVDGWSWPLVAADLAAAYEVPAQRLPPAPSFADFTHYLSRRPTDDAERYWRQTLGDVRTPSRLAATVPGVTAVTLTRRLDAAASEALAAWARRHRVTLGAVLTGAWALAVADECGTDEVVVGMATSGRPADLADADRMVGTFVSNVPVRVDCRSDSSSGSWIAAVQQALVDAGEHQLLAPDRMHALSGLGAADRLFDSLVVVQNYAGAGRYPVTLDAASDDPRITAVEMPVRTGVPVTVVVVPGTRLEVTITARVPEDDATRWLEALVRLLTALPSTGSDTIGAVRRPRDQRRAAVARPASHARRPAGGFDSTLETEIAEAWARALGHAAFGPDDNFFELGGHSLLMLAVQSGLSARLGRPLSIVELFQYPTVRGLARRLSATPDDVHVGAAHARAARQREALTRGRPVRARS